MSSTASFKKAEFYSLLYPSIFLRALFWSDKIARTKNSASQIFWSSRKNFRRTHFTTEYCFLIYMRNPILAAFNSNLRAVIPWSSSHIIYLLTFSIRSIASDTIIVYCRNLYFGFVKKSYHSWVWFLVCCRNIRIGKHHLISSVYLPFL